MRASPLLTALVLLAALPASAHEGAPFVARQEGEGPVWVALLLETTGPATWQLVGEAVGPRISSVMAEYATDGSLVFFDRESPNPVAEFAAGLGEERRALRPAMYGTDRVTLPMGTDRSATFYSVLMVAGDIGAWTLDVRGAARVLGMETGPALDVSSRTFASSAHAHAEAWAVSATAAVEARFELDVEGRFVGVYHAANSTTGSAYAETPAGTRTCLCTFTGAPGEENGPGRYAFRLEGAQARSDGDARVIGGDVRLPARP